MYTISIYYDRLLRDASCHKASNELTNMKRLSSVYSALTISKWNSLQYDNLSMYSSPPFSTSQLVAPRL